MKQIIVLGNHKQFAARRLGARLARVLQENGQEVLLAGLKTALPAHACVKTINLAPAAKAATLAKTFQKEKVQRVISLGSLLACEAAATAKLPYIYCEPENLKEEKPVKNKKTLLKKAHKVIVIGTGEKALDKKLYSSNAIRVKNPAVWVEHDHGYRPACFKKDNNLLAAGPLGKEGGIDTLLNVWKQLSVLHPTWHLTIVGEGAGKTTFKKFITKHHLQESTELVGAEADLHDLMRRADIFISPVRQAANLDQLLDAMASKLPVIATEQSGAAELLDAANGLLVASEQADALQAALDELMVNWGKRVGLAVEAAKMRDRFPFEVFAAFFEEA